MLTFSSELIETRMNIGRKETDSNQEYDRVFGNECLVCILSNNNNYKTCSAPISSKRIELSGAPDTGVVQTHNPGVRCKVHEQ